MTYWAAGGGGVTNGKKSQKKTLELYFLWRVSSIVEWLHKSISLYSDRKKRMLFSINTAF